MQNNTKLGIGLMVLTMFIFAVQDGISLYLTSKYNVFMVVMLRYWFFAAFVMTVSARQAGGLRHAARTKQPWMQGFRGVLLAAEIIVMMFAFTKIGLVESLAIFTANPLIVAALSGPVIGGGRRLAAVAGDFYGVLRGCDYPEPWGGGVFALCVDRGCLLRYVCGLCPAHPLCRPWGQCAHQLFLDGDRGGGGDDGGGRVVFGSDDSHRLCLGWPRCV